MSRDSHAHKMASVAVCVAKLSLLQLETLVIESVCSKTEISLEALTPPPPVVIPTRPANVAANADLGCFRHLCDDVMEALLVDHLSAVARHALTHRVCKAFCDLGKRLPWKTISLDEKCQYRKRADEILSVTPGADANQLLAFVRASESTLTKLSLTFKDWPNDSGVLVKVIRAAPKLTDLSLAGGALGVQPSPRLLRRLELGRSAVTSEATMKMLATATQLEHLGVDNGISIGQLKDTILAWRKARNGGEPMLESLSLGFQQCDMLQHLDLVRTLPNLQTLRLSGWHHKFSEDLRLPTGLRSINVEFSGFSNKTTGADDWSYQLQYAQADNPELVRGMLVACPRATSITIGWHLNSRNTDRQIAASLPLGEALKWTPESLVDLTLVGMRIVDDALDPLLTLKSLKTLTLRQCVTDLVRTHKHLADQGVCLSM